MIQLDDAKHRQALTLPEACAWIGSRTGKTPATSTAWRWVLKGVRGGIRLESFRIGGTTYTTPAMVQRFIDRTTGSASSAPATAAVAVPAIDPDHAARRHEIATAQQQLREACAPRRAPRRGGAVA